MQLADATACALLDDGSVACWGRIAWHGKAEDTAKPAGVLGVVGVKQLFVLPGLGCGRVANDSLVCWGDIDPAGHPAKSPANRQPTPAVGVERVKALSADAALRDDGTLFTWGGSPVTLTGVAENRRARTRDLRPARRRYGELPGAALQRRATPPPPAPPKKPVKKPKKPVKPAPPPAPKLESLPFSPAKQLAFDLGWCVVTTANKLECSEACGKPGKSQLDKVDRVVGRCVVQTTGAVRCDNKPVSGVTAPSALAGSCAIVKSAVMCWGTDGKAAAVETLDRQKVPFGSSPRGCEGGWTSIRRRRSRRGMGIDHWQPREELSRQEQALMKRLDRRAKAARVLTSASPAVV